jgi:glyceraldehyde-3-phosphate dehydrogenase/erythrose-4-phosphate dehydrogenase
MDAPKKSPAGGEPSLWLGINGFGRIGKLLTRQSLEGRDVNVVAINDPHMTCQQMAYALQNDSTHGRFKGEVTVSPDHKTLFVKDHGQVYTIACFHNEIGDDTPWALAGVDFVIECSGKINTNDQGTYLFQVLLVALLLSHTHFLPFPNSSNSLTLCEQADYVSSAERCD